MWSTDSSGPHLHKVEFRNALLSSNAYATFRPLIGDILFKLNPGPDTNQVNHRSSNLTFCLLNARSLRNKSVSFCDYVQDCKADIFSITEIWLTQNDTAVCKEITPNGYRLFHCPRTDRRGGGTALLCRESLHVRRLSAGEKTSFEFSEYMIDGLSLQLRLVIVYRPPYSAAHPVTSSTFFPEFSEYLESLVLSKVPICISGDFNVHLDVSDDADTIAFADLLESLCLTQHVKSPTHVMGHILDLIITRSSDNIIKGTPSPDCFLSDHCSVLCFLNVTKVLAIVKHINFRKLKSLDLVAFKNDIPGSDLCNIASNDCNEVAELYDNCMRSILDRHAPMTSKRVFTRPSAPWMSSNIMEAKRQRRQAERKWRSFKCQSDPAVFKRKRNHVTFLMNEARRVYYCTLIAENSHDQKHMFKVSKKLLNITVTQFCHGMKTHGN